MTDKKNKQHPKSQDIEPGHPDYRPGATGVQPKDHNIKKEAPPKKEDPNKPEPPVKEPETGKKKIVNEEEQNKVINEDESLKKGPSSSGKKK